MIEAYHGTDWGEPLVKPRIGITSAFSESEQGYYLKRQYVEAVTRAGGLPLLLPTTPDVAIDELAQSIDGILLSGGGDIDPHWFGEEPHVRNGSIDPIADTFEIHLCRSFLAAERPIFGICRGVQVLNVAAGGDIYQDLGEQTGSTLQHAQKAPDWHATHQVTVNEKSSLARILGTTRMRVNSFHHQGIRTIAPHFRVAAKAGDGLVEAIEKPGVPFTLGVQWHPERTFTKSPPELALFQAFVQACSDVTRTK